jgi:hypothetical protein
MMWRRFRLWLRRPLMDPLTAMALLVRAVDHEHPGWTELHIVSQRGHPGGGVTFRILQ